jgi:hypothetical protein
MNELCFRPALESDLPGIVAMLANDDLGHAREDASTPLHPDYLRAFAAINQDPNQMVVVAEQSGDVV